MAKPKQKSHMEKSATFPGVLPIAGEDQTRCHTKLMGGGYEHVASQDYIAKHLMPRLMAVEFGRRGGLEVGVLSYMEILELVSCLCNFKILERDVSIEKYK